MIVGLLASLPPPVPPPSTTFPTLLLEPEDFRGVPALRLTTWRTAGDPKESELISAHLYKALYKEPAASGALVANIVSTDM